MKILFGLFMVTGWLQGIAQENPVSWKFGASKSAEGHYELALNATVPSPWHLYSQNTPDGGPMPTTFQFKKNPLVTFNGDVVESGVINKFHDENFDTDVIYFAGDVKFTQKIVVKSKAKTLVRGEVEYMVCNDKKCLPPAKVPFEIQLN